MDCFTLALVGILVLASIAVLTGLGMLVGALLQHRAEQQFWDNEEEE